MKILHLVESFAPVPGGMQEVVRQLSKRLVRFGHNVTVATSYCPERRSEFKEGVRIASFAVGGNQVRGYTGEVEAYQRFLLEERFDVITAFAAQQWATDLLLPLLDHINGRKVFVPTGFSALSHREYRNYFAQMPNWLRRFDMNVFHSETYRDIRFARGNMINNIVVIPNGADEEEMCGTCPVDIRAELGIPEAHFLILHVGSHTGLKGHAEAIEIFRRAGLRNSTFLLVGNLNGGCYQECCARAEKLNSSQEFRSGDRRIVVTSLGRQATIAAFRSADIFLFPSNIECSPLVLYEAVASRTPFMSTDVGNASEIAAWTGGGVLLPTRKVASAASGGWPGGLRLCARLFPGLRPLVDDGYGLVVADVPGSARILARLRADAQRLDELREAGFANWRERFTWEKIAREYERLYARLCHASGCVLEVGNQGEAS